MTMVPVGLSKLNLSGPYPCAPPLSRRCWPLTNADRSLARYSAALATSSTVPILFIGRNDSTHSRIFAVAPPVNTPAPSIVVGRIELTATLRCPISFARTSTTYRGADDVEGRPENWQDPMKAGQRLNFQDRFEAIQMPTKGGVNRWTWRVVAEHYTALADSIRTTIDGRDDAAVRTVIDAMHKMPGFRGVRGQVTALRKLVATEWKRTHDGAACPFLPARVQGYQRYRTNRTVPAELVVDRIRRSQVPIAFAWRKNDPQVDIEAAA